MRLYFIDCLDEELDRYKPYMVNVSKVYKGSGKESNVLTVSIMRDYYVANVLSNDSSLLDHPAFIDREKGYLDIYLYHNRDWIRVDRLDDSVINELIGR